MKPIKVLTYDGKIHEVPMVQSVVHGADTASKPKKARQRGDFTRKGAKGASGRRFGMGMFGIPMRSCRICHCTFSPLHEDETRCRACSERSVRSLVIDHLANN